ncbi:MAG: type I-U CRISPR-associated protein Csx17 [Planctomycetaceae bacterium]
MQTRKLSGCTPIPLSGYLKALGVLRVISEQLDQAVRGWWEADVFHLSTDLTPEQLCTFLLSDYAPTPLVAPWNGGSGFFPKDNRTALDAICASEADRFREYRELVAICQTVLTNMSLVEKPDGDAKPLLLQNCRNVFPDNALQWLDAAFVLTDDGPKYPPLLGTGGNDGRLEFTNNYMQRLTEVFDVQTGQPSAKSHSLLMDSLFAACGETRGKASIGQFDPGSAGGANSSGGYDADPTMNVWDFILMLEGAIAFAGASVRKLEHAAPGSLAYPFCVRPAGVGYGSAAMTDEESSRSEMWMPLWSQPATFSTITHLLSEGRVDVGRRRARHGVDFARAIASVGVDRGIDSFQRFGFQQRNGLSYFAVPLGRFDASTPTTNASMISQVDRWLDRFRRAATGQHAPARASSALRRLETAIMQGCQRDDKASALQMLVALGEAGMAVANSPKLRDADYPVPPVPLLSPDWLAHCYDKSSVHAREFRLAAALVSMGFASGLKVDNQLRLDPVGPFRRHVEPIDHEKLRGKYRRAAWVEQTNDPSIVWNSFNLIGNLNRVLNRRIIDVIRLSESTVYAPFDGRCTAWLSDLAEFIEGRTDDAMIDRYARCLMLIDWPKLKHTDIPWKRDPVHLKPPAAYALLKLCLVPRPVPSGDHEIDIKLDPQIARRAAAGNLHTATTLASRRLVASGLNPAIRHVADGQTSTNRRIAAALVFPISSKSLLSLTKQVMRREADDAFDVQYREKISP